MSLKHEPPPQQGKKRKSTALNQLSDGFPKDQTLANLSLEDSVTDANSKKKVCFCQGNSGVHSNRTILEIAKMCSPADVLKSLSFLNRQWMEVCNSNELSKELWYTFLEDFCIPSNRSTHPKSAVAAYTRQQQTVVDIRRDEMRILNKATGVWTSTMLSEPMHLDSCSYALFLDGSILCCGGPVYLGKKSRYMYPINRIAGDGQVSELRPMKTGRESHGLVAYGAKIFAFGGVADGRKLFTIEMFTESWWSEIPTKLSVHHYFFVPCIYKGLIYLCESFRKPMEVFNPESLTIDVLATTSLDENCTAVTVYEGKLVLIGKKSVSKWNFDSSGAQVSSICPELSFLCFKKRNVLYGDLLYVVASNALLVINMKTLSFEYRPN